MLRTFRSFFIGAIYLGILSTALHAGEDSGNRVFIKPQTAVSPELRSSVQPGVFYHRLGNSSVRQASALGNGSSRAARKRVAYPDVSVPAYGPLPIWRPGTQPAAKLRTVRRATVVFGPVRRAAIPRQVVAASHRPSHATPPNKVNGRRPRVPGITAPEEVPHLLP